MTETVILTEGFHDRAFWKGLLEAAGCQNVGAPVAGQRNAQVLDPWNSVVSRGQFAFRSRTGAFIRVQPCGGNRNVPTAARVRLEEREAKPLTRLVACIDTDVDVTSADAVRPAFASGIDRVVRRVAPDASPDATGAFALSTGTSVVEVRWEADDPPSDLLPHQQCLERLIAAALAEIYPERARAVRDWLASRPSPPTANPKAHAWSHMAGWHPDLGCETFLSEVWTDLAVAAALRKRLQATGAWDTIEKVVA